MRKRLLHIALLATGLLAVRVAAAQEGEYPNTEPEVVVIQQPAEVYEGEGVTEAGEFRSSSLPSSPSTLQSRDPESSRSLPKAKPSTDLVKPAEKKEDVLSFNFLYYFIQKYKLSDIIDE